MLLGVGAVATKTYVDDVFSTFLYNGTGSAQNINNGIDVSGKGGLVWIKARNAAYSNSLFDTVRGKTKRIKTNSSDAQDTDSAYLADFKTNGFEVATDSSTNSSSGTFTSWTFRKAPGFFDVVTYTGNETALRNISHSLGCEPGLILIKRTDSTSNWWVYHRDLGDTDSNYSKAIKLNDSGSRFDDYKIGNRSKNTSTTFMVGNDPQVNGTGTYVAYLFAGGESTAATARSVDFDESTGDYIQTATSDSPNISPGTGDFCIEAWVNPGEDWTDNDGFFSHTGGLKIYKNSDSDGLGLAKEGVNTPLVKAGYEPEQGQWTHVAFTRSGTSLKMFLNGTEVDSATDSTDFGPSTNQVSYIGWAGAGYFHGKVSNLRVVKGSAVYTSSFKPPTEPLTNISGTGLLCCNNASVTGATVGTLSVANAGVTPEASTDSPFDDPAGFVFGDAGDQNVIKCGSYVGNGSSTGPEINLGWEPSWLLIKRSSGSEDWMLFDNIRTSSRTDMHLDDLRPNSSSSEGDGAGGDSNSFLNWTSTGFKLQSNSTHTNDDEDTYIFCAIRRPDGYVGKPPSLGTDVFAMDTGSGSSTIPTFDSGFPVDMRMLKYFAQSGSWYLGTRLMGEHSLYTNTNAAENTDTWAQWDSNVGDAVSWGSNEQAWQWKRHAGFDVVCYEGDGVAGRQIRHSMNKTVEMMWLKNRSSSSHNWVCYHKGLNGGTNPEDYRLRLNTSDAEGSNSNYLNSTAPTSTHITLGSINAINANGSDYIAILFASVDGISKVGTYNGSSGDVSVTTGFQPRLVILKRFTGAAGTGDWYVYDTTRGFTGSGNDDKALKLNSSAAETTMTTGTVTSTGFTITMQGSSHNSSGSTYIYYAHA